MNCKNSDNCEITKLKLRKKRISWNNTICEIAIFGLQVMIVQKMEIRSKHNCKIQIHSCIPFISRINKHHIFNHLNLATSENSKVNAVREATSLIAHILGTSMESKENSIVKIIILYFEKKIVFRISLYLRMMLFVIWVAIQCEWIVSKLNSFQVKLFPNELFPICYILVYGHT